MDLVVVFNVAEILTDVPLFCRVEFSLFLLVSSYHIDQYLLSTLSSDKQLSSS